VNKDYHNFETPDVVFTGQWMTVCSCTRIR